MAEQPKQQRIPSLGYAMAPWAYTVDPVTQKESFNYKPDLPDVSGVPSWAAAFTPFAFPGSAVAPLITKEATAPVPPDFGFWESLGYRSGKTARDISNIPSAANEFARKAVYEPIDKAIVSPFMQGWGFGEDALPEATVPTTAPTGVEVETRGAKPAGAGFSFNTPYVPGYVPSGDLPIAPDLQAKLDALRGLRPEGPIDRGTAILEGLIAGGRGISSRDRPLDAIYQLAIGALGGYTGHQREAKKATEAQREFDVRVVGAESDVSQQEFQNQMTLQRAKQEREAAAAAARAERAKALSPSISSGFLITKSMEGGQIKNTVVPLPNSAVERQIANITPEVIEADTSLLFQTMPPEVIAQAAQGSNAAELQQLAGAGVDAKTVSTTAKRQILNYIKANDPEMYTAILQSAIDLKAAQLRAGVK